MEAKEKLRKRAIERKRQIDLEEKENQIARDKAAERFTAMKKELEDRKSRIEELDAEAKKKETALLRVAEKSKDIDFGILGFATADQKDQLQEIKGVGPFIEEKLNALGIYTFAQISRMNSDLEDKINEAIEFFPGRIRGTNGQSRQDPWWAKKTRVTALLRIRIVQPFLRMCLLRWPGRKSGKMRNRKRRGGKSKGGRRGQQNS